MISSNKAIEMMRRRTHREKSLLVDMEAFADCTWEEALTQRDAADAVRNVISSLPDKERIIISLNLIEEKTHKDIARMMRLPVNTISTIISRAKEKIRIKLYIAHQKEKT